MRRNWNSIRRSTWIRADELRIDQTLSEKLLWRRIRASQLGVRFRRQHPIGPYIVDFCCPKENLIIEIDGNSHWEASAGEHDAQRSEYLRTNGWRIIRYTNREVQENIDSVVQDILIQIRK
jgi:very-short-patch-repair endonuclease